MAENERVSLKCQHCGYEFTNKAPAAPGKFFVPCKNPECKKPVHFVYPAQPPKNEEKPKAEVKLGFQNNGDYRFKCSNPSCGQIYLIPAEKVKPGKNKVTCMKCKTVHEFEKEPSEEEKLKCRTSHCKGVLEKPDRGDGSYTVICEKCQAKYGVAMNAGKVVSVTLMTPPPPPPPKQYKMKLVVSQFLGKKEYMLHKGSHYVGRDDDEAQSDFAIKDKYASRRSLRIDVNENGGELLYKLKVERAANPVYHNNHELAVNDVIFITYGDTLKIGKTLIKVQKVDK